MPWLPCTHINHTVWLYYSYYCISVQVDVTACAAYLGVGAVCLDALVAVLEALDLGDELAQLGRQVALLHLLRVAVLFARRLVTSIMITRFIT